MTSNNNIPKGYKQTKLGIIPKEWEIKKFEDIAIIKVGKDLKEEHYSKIKTEKYKYPVYSNTVENYGLYGYYDKPEYESNSLTIVRRGIGLGKTFARYEKFGAIGRLLVVFPNQNVNHEFLTEYTNYKINIYKESSGIPQLTGVQLGKYRIVIPPLPEQKAIAKILSTWDKAISNQQLLIDKYKLKKKGLMQKLLAPEKDWKEVRLGDLCSRIGDGIHSTPKYDKNGDYYFVNGNNLRNGSIIIDEKTKKINQIEFENHKRPIDAKTTILLSINGTIGNIAFYKNENIILGKSAAYLNINKEIDKIFLFNLFKSERIRNYFQNELTGSTIKNLSLKSIRNTPIYLPKISEQTKIAKILSSADKEISILEQQLSKLKEQKKGLMQVLLTGQKRVKPEEYGDRIVIRKQSQGLNKTFNYKAFESDEHFNFIASDMKSFDDYFEKRKQEFVYMLFIDIDGFSTKYQKTGDDGLVELLDNYYQTIIPIITDLGGVVEKTIGDGIICLFGEPFIKDNSKNNLLMKAHSCAQSIIEVSQGASYSSKIALHSGNIAYYKNLNLNYMEYTIIGSTLTELFRLETVSKENCINFYCDTDYAEFIKKDIIQNNKSENLSSEIVWEKSKPFNVKLKGINLKSVSSLYIKNITKKSD